MLTSQNIQQVIPILSLVLPFIIAIYTLSYYTLMLRSQSKTRRAQLFMQIYSRFNEERFWETNFQMRKNLDLWEAEAILDTKYLTLDTKNQAQFNALASFYEGIGVLVKREIIDLELVNDLMASSILTSWESMKPIILRMRENAGDESQYKGFEYVYDRIKEKSEN